MTDGTTEVDGTGLRLVFGDCELDLAAGQLRRAGQAVPLAPRPFAVLAHLALRAGRLVSKDELLDAVWGHRHVSDSVLKVAVNAVRQALGDSAGAPRHLHTVPRRGYRFDGDVAAPSPRLPEQGPAGPAPPADPGPSSPLPAGPAGNLPPAPALIGRAAQLQALGVPPAPLLTLVGPGGVGKTALALNLAERWPAPTDGRWLLRLDALDEAASLLATLASTLALSAGSARDLPAMVRALAPMDVLLVLDNAEHLVEPVAALVAALRDGAPGVRMLVTSQRPLGVAGEQVFPVEPLGLPPATAREGWDEHPACALFVCRVRGLLPAYAPDLATAQDVVAICRRLDGLPLALELAAARVPLLGTGGVRARLQDRLALLTAGSRDAAPRHRTLRHALQWSWDLLAPSPQDLLARLSICVGSFDLGLAEALADDAGAVLDDLQALHDASLLMRAGDEATPRWRLLDSVHIFAAERLAAQPVVADTVRRRLQSVVLARWRAAEAAYLGRPLLDWLRPLHAEAGHLNLAMQGLLAQGADEPAARGDAIELAAAAMLFWARGGQRQQGLRWWRALSPWAAADTDPGRRGRWALATAVLGLYGQQLPREDTLAAAEQAATLLMAQGDQGRAALALYSAGQMLLRLGRPPAERDANVRRLRELQGPGAGPRTRLLAGWNEALLMRDRGDIAGYGERCMDFLARARAVDDAAEAWSAAWGLAQALVMQQAFESAVELLDRTVDEIHGAGLQRQYATLIALAASVRLGLEGGPTTVALAREATVLLRSEGLLWWMGDALSWLPLWQGRTAAAVRIQAWADARTGGEARGPVFAWLRSGFVARLRALPESGRWLRELAERPEGELSEAEVLALAFDERQRRRTLG